MAKTKTLTQVLATSNKKMKANEKLAAITKIVNKAKARYGNEDSEIGPVEVCTTEGATDMAYLSGADKLAIASRCINEIRINAIETTKQQEGAVLDSEIARLLAVSPVLSNLDTTSGSEFI